MLKTAVLSLVASLNLGSENQFFESEFALPAGVSEVSSQMDFNAVSMFSATGEDLPKFFMHSTRASLRAGEILKK